MIKGTALTPDEVKRIGQLAGCIESTQFPAAYYCQEEILGLRAIASELRLIVGLPPNPWPELAANAEPIPDEVKRP